jgi:hypothetical protein
MNAGGGCCRSSDSADPGPGLGHAYIGPQVDFLVFDGLPEALDEDVVAPGPLAIR